MKKLAVMLMALLLFLAGCSVPAAEVSLAESGEKSAPKEHFTILASLPDDDIYLYEINDRGVVLYQDGYGRYFDWFSNWYEMSDNMRINYADFDGDGVKDIAIAGASVWRDHNTSGLHLLKISENADENLYGRNKVDKYTDYTLVSHDLLLYEDFSLDGAVVSYKGETFQTISDVDIKDVGGIHFLEMSFVRFTEDNKFVFSVPIGHSYKEYSRSFVFASMIITVSFDGTNSKIENYTFEKQEVSYEHY
jgi:hypothetical protein